MMGARHPVEPAQSLFVIPSSLSFPPENQRTFYRAVKVIVGHLTGPTVSYLCISNSYMIELAALTLSETTCIDKTERELK